MVTNFNYIMYGIAAAAVVGVIFAFKRDSLIRSRRLSNLAQLKSALPASASYQASLAEVDDTIAKIDNDFLLEDKNPYGNHLSIGGEPHGYYGRNRAGPG